MKSYPCDACAARRGNAPCADGRKCAAWNNWFHVAWTDITRYAAERARYQDHLRYMLRRCTLKEKEEKKL